MVAGRQVKYAGILGERLSGRTGTLLRIRAVRHGRWYDVRGEVAWDDGEVELLGMRWLEVVDRVRAA
ncbi:MAG: hypothetical protein ACE5HF_10545 [Gemmatimonadota bacterium]